MNPWKLATFGATLAAGLVVTTAATASSPAPDLDHFKAEYRCHDMSEGTWSPGADLLAKRRGVKTTVYALPGDGTGLVRKGTNKATASALASYGSLRLVCRDRVPFGTRVAWS